MTDEQVRITCTCGLEATGPLSEVQSLYDSHQCHVHESIVIVPPQRQHLTLSGWFAILILIGIGVCCGAAITGGFNR